MQGTTWWWVLLALLAGWLLSGCGRSSSAPIALTSQPAARPAAERVTGAWHGTMLVDDDSVQGRLSDQQIAELEAMQMGMEFGADGSLLLTGVHGDKPYTSRNQWKLLRDGGNEVTILSIEPSGQEKEIVLLFEGDDVFLMPLKTEVATLGAMRFERLR